MSSGMKGFVFNRNSDWEEVQSRSHGVLVSDDSVFLKSHAFLVSRLLDTGENGMSWHNLIIKANIPANAKLIFKIFASDVTTVVIPFKNGESHRLDLNDFLKKDKNLELKMSVFNSMNCLTFENPSEVPLFDLKGRYLAFCIESINYSEVPVKIDEMQINFPFTSFAQYLPEVYQNVPNSAFIHRFISIFQSIYLELDDIIDNIPEKFEPSCSDLKFIHWICSLFNIDSSIYDESHLRSILKNMTHRFRSCGTRDSLTKLISEYVGAVPILIEKFRITNNDYYKLEKEIVDKLFGKSNYNFTVILHDENIKNEQCYANLLKIIHENIPIDAICNLVILTDNIILGVHCYVGVNSFISNTYVQKTEGNFIKLGA